MGDFHSKLAISTKNWWKPAGKGRKPDKNEQFQKFKKMAGLNGRVLKTFYNSRRSILRYNQTSRHDQPAVWSLHYWKLASQRIRVNTQRWELKSQNFLLISLRKYLRLSLYDGNFSDNLIDQRYQTRLTVCDTTCIELYTCCIIKTKPFIRQTDRGKSLHLEKVKSSYDLQLLN